MTISAEQRRQIENNIRAATDRLLQGQIPAGGACDITTLARESGVSRAALYRTYGHLKAEFERRLEQMRSAGYLPDPRAAQISRLKADNARLRERLHERDQQVAELTGFKTLAVSRLHAQHTEITRLRAALTRDQNVRLLAPSPEQL